jgi:hypothetical protein
MAPKTKQAAKSHKHVAESDRAFDTRIAAELPAYHAAQLKLERANPPRHYYFRRDIHAGGYFYLVDVETGRAVGWIQPQCREDDDSRAHIEGIVIPGSFTLDIDVRQSEDIRKLLEWRLEFRGWHEGNADAIKEHDD